MADKTDPRPTVWIVTRDLGKFSEVWLLRQILNLRRLRPVVITWADHRKEKDDTPVHVLPFDPDLGVGAARWTNRLARMAAGNYFASRGAELQALKDLARRDPPDVILGHFGHTALRVLPLAQALGVPMVCHFHGLDLSSSLNNKWYRWSLQRHAPHFAATITVGTRQREMLAPFYPPERTALIPCGVPVAEFTRDTAKGEGVRFVTVSRLVPQKGVDHCLRAMAELPRGMAHLDVIGDGPERPRLEGLVASLGLGGDVTFHGAQPPSGVRAALSGATALLQHSLDAPDGWFEGFGVTVAEASAMEVPTIASRCGGLLDQVVDNETGFLVPQRDHRAMADAMRKLAGEPGLADRMGRAARQRTEAMFDMKDQVAKLEDLLLAQVRG